MRREAEVDQAAVERVERELVEAESALAERAQAHEALLAETSADTALGVVSPGHAATRTRPSEEALDLAREQVERLRRAVPVVRERWQQAQAEQRERERNAAARRLGDACGKANDAATKLAKSLAESDRLARDLLARRAEVEAAARTAGARDDASPRPVERRSPQLLWGAAGTGRNAPEGWRDEPSWADGIDVLRDVLQGGPRRPLHDAEVEAGRKEDERERQDRELLGWLRRNPGRAPEVLSRDGLSPALRAEVERIVAEAAERVAARQAAEAERGRAERRERAEQEAVA